MSGRTIQRRSRFRAPIPSGPWRAWRRSRHDPGNGHLPSHTFREQMSRRELAEALEDVRREGIDTDPIALEIRAEYDAVGAQSAHILDPVAALLERVEALRYLRRRAAPPPDRPRTPRLIGAPRAPGAAARA